MLKILHMLTVMVHTKCRSGLYPFSAVQRALVAPENVPWSVNCPEYKPVEYNSHVLENKDWADPDIGKRGFEPKWNELDGKINRKSHTGVYQVVNGRPLNPEGRTGISGRGVLGKWGPNHAADPIVTRWKPDSKNHHETDLPVLQFCGIQRKDCGQWAIPGGMVDPGEQISETLRREFMEEAFNSLEASSEKVKEIEAMITEFFKNGTEIYRGYVDDPRNTDNAWMETIAVNFHDGENKTFGKFTFQAGDDAKNVKWIDLDRALNLYASHTAFLQSVAKLHKAHW